MYNPENRVFCRKCKVDVRLRECRCKVGRVHCKSTEIKRLRNVDVRLAVYTVRVQKLKDYGM